MAGEMFKLMAGVDVFHVPYRGAQVFPALLAGDVQVYFGPLLSSIEHIRAGKLRALAVTTTTRSAALPGGGRDKPRQYDDAQHSSRHDLLLLGIGFQRRWPELYVDSVVSPGCPQIAKDWAVVKLQTGVPRVRPYDYPRTDPMLEVDKPVTQVSARADNFMIGDKFPKTVERCYLRVINPQSSFPVLTDCNTGPGSSGAAQLIEDEKGNTVVGAIHVADSVSGKPKSGFDPHTLFSISVPLAGDFLQALREALK